MKRWASPLLVALALPLAGCATGPLSGGGGGESTARTLAELEEQIGDLQKKAAMNEAEIARLRRRVAELETGSGGSAARPAPRRQEQEPEARGERPGDEREVSPVEPPLLEEVDLDEPVPAPGEVPPGRPAPGGGSTPPVEEEVQALYDQGYSLYHQGRYLDAEATFQRFLQSHPDTELTDNAQYWIGEARYARRDYPGALAAFRETAARFPEGNKVPDALLKAGQCLEALGDVGGARESYREVVRRFPATGAAAAAQERLDLLP